MAVKLWPQNARLEITTIGSFTRHEDVKVVFLSTASGKSTLGLHVAFLAAKAEAHLFLFVAQACSGWKKLSNNRSP